jgi:hypothetical protein
MRLRATRTDKGSLILGAEITNLQLIMALWQTFSKQWKSTDLIKRCPVQQTRKFQQPKKLNNCSKSRMARSAAMKRLFPPK